MSIMGSSSLLLVLWVGVLIGALVSWLVARARVPALREERARLVAQLDAERRSASDRSALLERAELTLRDAFGSLSAEALRQNNQSFLTLAETRLSELHRVAAGDLDLRQRAVDDLVRPLREALARVDDTLHQVEKERLTSYAGLLEQVRAMAHSQRALQEETGNLVKALRAPHVRGRWGEIQLRRVVEMAGMLDYCDFEEQATVEGDLGRLRPDLVVRLPGGKTVIVDAKAPATTRRASGCSRTTPGRFATIWPASAARPTGPSFNRRRTSW
jgi:DNA recombination protein RmuC